MTSITQLYNNIKTFVLQTFESKEEEDINLPIEVERLFEYIDGEMSIVDSPIILELSDNIMKLRITGNSFSTYSSTPFTYNGKVFVDWGDNSGIVEYTGGKLTHTYSSSAGHTVKIYGDITSLGNYCFERCSSLTSVTIPSSVTSLGNNCFENCTGLTSVTIPSSVTSLGTGCFASCTGLTSIDIPNGVTNLRNSCFYNCRSLTSITIPNSVTSIEGYCFSNCTSLAYIYLNWTSTEIITYNNTWIGNTSSNLLFHIPNSTTSLYTAKGYPSNKLLEVGD